MEQAPQNPIFSDPAGPSVHPGPCALIKPGAGLPTQLTIPEAVPTKLDQMESGQTKPLPAATEMTSISRPRPSALGNKQTIRISVESSKDIDLIPVCIPGPQSTSAPPQSPTDSAFPVHSPPSAHSPQSYINQPYLSPSPSLPPPQSIPKPSMSPTQSRAETEKSAGDISDFR